MIFFDQSFRLGRAVGEKLAFRTVSVKQKEAFEYWDLFTVANLTYTVAEIKPFHKVIG